MMEKLVIICLNFPFLLLSAHFLTGTSGIDTKNEFPLKEFLETAVKRNLSDFDEFDEFEAELKKSYLCSHKAKKCCSCKDTCFAIRDCCIDKLWDPLNPIPLPEYLMKFRTEVERHSKAHCKGVEPFVSMTRFNSIRGYFMIDNCPLSTEKSDFGSKCVNDSSLSDRERVPVFVDGTVLYKNQYCALCNGVSFFKTVNLTVNCCLLYTSPSPRDS